MRKGWKARLDGAALALALAGLTACAAPAEGPALYARDDCRKALLTDQETGAAIIGAEDIALDERRGRLFIAAYDRRAAERAARKGALSVPAGGVYAVSLSDLFDPAMGALDAAPVAAGRDVPGGARPQAIHFDPLTDELSIINRAYQRIDGEWRMTARIERLGVDGAIHHGAEMAAPCAANSLVGDNGRALVSFDHADCGLGAALEDVFRLRRSGVMEAGGAVLFDKAAFANGLATTAAGDLVLAATRENALLVMQRAPGGMAEAARIETPGGPDNLKRAADGSIVAALHPSTFRIFLNRRLGVGQAPSRIVKADPETGAVALLFDDPDGSLFSAATVAVETRDGLVAGSVTDSGLLVCRRAGA